MNRLHTVEISSLLASSGKRIHIEDAVTLEDFEGLVFPDPARLVLDLDVVDRLLRVAGSILVRTHGVCDGCAEPLDRDFRLDVDERLDPDAGRDRDPFGESNAIVGSRLDLADLAQQLVYSCMPLGWRCSSECRGLCGLCGANLNASPCSCTNGDSRG